MVRKRGVDRLPAKLKRARTQFEEWRSVREKRRIPGSLWNLAEELAKEFGVFRTSRALRLNYKSLKSRVTRDGREARTKPKATFVELVPGLAHGGSANEGHAELEDGNGARVRVSWRGMAPALGELSRGFFYGESS